MSLNFWKYVFLVISICEIIAQFDFLPFQKFDLITKPMLMPALALYFYFSTRNVKDISSTRLVYLAMFFAWLGDVFLMFSGKNPIYFMFGLGAFLVMQILYIIIFRIFIIQELIQKKYVSLLIFFAGLVLLAVLFPNLGDLKIPVLIYFAAILTMVLSALALWARQNNNISIFYGALLFMISDSIIALNKFNAAIPLAGAYIMITYILAQWLIINGLRLNKK